MNERKKLGEEGWAKNLREEIEKLELQLNKDIPTSCHLLYYFII